jgi:antitoxin VapB
MADDTTIDTAKVFMTGRSQAVRLPKSCRFDTDEVLVRRIGRTVLLSPRDDDWAGSIRALFSDLGTGSEPAPIERAPAWRQPARKALR